MPFSRPQGFLTTNYVNLTHGKENPFGTLKKFLFDDTSGRTDVIFLGELNTYVEDPLDSASLVGGLADGIAKALINTGRRTLYGTPIYWGYHNTPYDPAVYFEETVASTDWTTIGNPTGKGACLVGTRYCFDNYLYGKGSANNPNKRFLPWFYNVDDTSPVYPSTSYPTMFTPDQEGFGDWGITQGAYIANTTQLSYWSGNNLLTNAGPISYPWFLENRSRSILSPAHPVKFPVAILNASGIITEMIIDAVTMDILQGETPLAYKFPETFNFVVGSNANTLVASDSRFSISAGRLIFESTVESFLMPFLRDVKFYSTSFTGTINKAADIYLEANALDGGDVYVFNKFTPVSYDGLGNEYLHASASLAADFNLHRGLVDSLFINTGLGTETQRGIPTTRHYTRVPYAGLTVGGTRCKFNFPFSQGLATSGFVLTLENFNPASKSVTTVFAYRHPTAANDQPSTVYRNRRVECNTNLGKFFDSVSYNPLTINTKDNGANPLYTAAGFVFKYGYLEMYGAAGTNNAPNGVYPCTLQKDVSGTGTWTTIRNVTSNFNPLGTLTTTPAPPPAYKVRSAISNSLATHAAAKIGFSFTGWNIANSITGNINVVNQWAEDTNNTNGISFSHAYILEDFRSGDLAYAFQSTSVQQHFAFLFQAIKNRQAANENKKIVIVIHAGRFETANPGGGYLGGWSQSYFKSINTIQKAYKAVGLTDDDVVFWFVGPVPGPDLGKWEYETPDYSPATSNYVSLTNVKRVFYDGDLMPRINVTGGLLAPTDPWTDNRIDPEVGNVVYSSFDDISTTAFLRADLTNPANRDTYSTGSVFNNGLTTTFAQPSAESFLLLGELMVAAVEGNTSSVYFAPIWVKEFSKILGYTTDPVNETPLEFISVSADPVDISSYLESFYALVDSDNKLNPLVLQAFRVLARTKHKILQ